MDFNSFEKTELVDMLRRIYKDTKYMEKCAKESLEKYKLENDTHDHARSLTFDMCASWIYDGLGIQYQRIKLD